MSTLPPIHREILVDAPPDEAFDVFTGEIGQWWPVGEFSVHGEGSTVSFADGRIVERSSTGATEVWGTVTQWEPPSCVAFTWHPGSGEERASAVTVRFAPAGTQTLVT